MKRIAISCLAAAALVAAAPSAASAAVKKYVAFGDSYASGPGLPVAPNSPDDTNCARSNVNYPSQIAQARGYGAKVTGDWIDFTCEGARADRTRLDSDPQFPNGVSPWGGLTDQVQTWAAGLGVFGEATELVTISIGGNDKWKNADFGSPYSVLGKCGESQAEWFYACNTDPNLLQTSDITADKFAHAIYENVKFVHQRAPKAKILITSYPWIVPKSNQTTCNGGPAWSYGPAGELTYLHGILSKLLAAQTGGATLLEDQLDVDFPGTPTAVVRVVDTYNPSQNHHICQAVGSRWVDRPGTATSLHPTLLGMQGIGALAVTKYNSSF